MDNSDNVMQCMEIVGSNRAVRRTIAAPGLDIWIDSRPLGIGAAGGDVHYVSTCGGGHVTRLALADVAGHGKAADGRAVVLRKLMRKYINTLDQTRFARTLNREFAADVEFGRFATAILLTYFAPTRHLIICSAGHGRPLLYSAQHAKWQYLDLKCGRLSFAQSFASSIPLGTPRQPTAGRSGTNRISTVCRGFPSGRHRVAVHGRNHGIDGPSRAQAE